MLVEFAVTNYRSIKEEARLSLVAGTGREHSETNVATPELSVSKGFEGLVLSAAIYGANAAGKSNLLRAVKTMQGIVIHSHRMIDEPLPVLPFLLDPSTSNKLTTFDLTCIVEGVRYQYGFSATRSEVHEEWLYAWPLGRTQMWFERNRTESGDYSFKFGDKLMGDREVWRRATRPNALFLSTAAALNSAQLKSVWGWFRNRLSVTVGGWSNEFTLDYCDDLDKSGVVGFLNAADLGISDLRVIAETFSAEMLPEEMSSLIKEDILKDLGGTHIKRARISHKLANSPPVELDLEEESDGTQKILALAGPWLDALEKGKVVVIDELHENLHPALVRFLVEQFHDPKLNTKGAQLIFSTHDTSVLNQEVFRRDQVWFCERDRNLATSLFPLTDFRPRKGRENLELAYLEGRYGAVPYIPKRPLRRARISAIR